MPSEHRGQGSFPFWNRPKMSSPTDEMEDDARPWQPKDFKGVFEDDKFMEKLIQDADLRSLAEDTWQMLFKGPGQAKKSRRGKDADEDDLKRIEMTFQGHVGFIVERVVEELKKTEGQRIEQLKKESQEKYEMLDDDKYALEAVIQQRDETITQLEKGDKAIEPAGEKEVNRKSTEDYEKLEKDNRKKVQEITGLQQAMDETNEGKKKLLQEKEELQQKIQSLENAPKPEPSPPSEPTTSPESEERIRQLEDAKKTLNAELKDKTAALDKANEKLKELDGEGTDKRDHERLKSYYNRVEALLDESPCNFILEDLQAQKQSLREDSDKYMEDDDEDEDEEEEEEDGNGDKKETTAKDGEEAEFLSDLADMLERECTFWERLLEVSQQHEPEAATDFVARAREAAREHEARYGWLFTANMVVLLFFVMATVAEGRKYAYWDSSNEAARAMYIEQRYYVCASLPHMWFFWEYINTWLHTSFLPASHLVKP